MALRHLRRFVVLAEALHFARATGLGLSPMSILRVAISMK